MIKGLKGNVFHLPQVVLPNLAIIRLGVYEESGKLIGHRIMPVEGLRPGQIFVNQVINTNTVDFYSTVSQQISAAQFTLSDAVYPDQHS